MKPTATISLLRRIPLSIRPLLICLALALSIRFAFFSLAERDTLDVAFEAEDEGRIIALLRKGADPDAIVCTRWELQTWLDPLPLHLLSHEAIKTLPHRCANSSPLLHAAMELRSPLPVVEELIQRKAMLQITDSNGDSAIAVAILYGYYDVVKRLAPFQEWRGLSPQQQSKLYPSSVITPIAGTVQVVKREEAHRKIQWFVLKRLRDSGTPLAPELLEAALRRNSPEAIAFLLDNGVDVNASIGPNKTTVLIEACRYPHQGVSLVDLLLKRGANPNRTDIFGENALDVTLTGANADIIHSLLQHGASFDLPVKNRKQRFDKRNRIKSLLSKPNSNTYMGGGGYGGPPSGFGGYGGSASGVQSGQSSPYIGQPIAGGKYARTWKEWAKAAGLPP